MIARLWIGGDLPRSRSHVLVLAVRRAQVSTGAEGWEDVICQPRSIEGLIEALTPEGHLHLQGEPRGLHPPLDTVHELGLSYRYWSGNLGMLEVGGGGADAPLYLFAPRPDLPLVEHAAISKAIVLLQAGEVHGALLVLEKACPPIPELPPLRLVEG